MIDSFVKPLAIADSAAERNFLACVIKSEEGWMRVPQNFSGDAFNFDINRILWTTIDHLYSKGAKIDPVTLGEALPEEAQKGFQDLGGWKYIDTLRELPIDPLNVEREAAKLLEYRTRRRVRDAGEKIAGLPNSQDTLPEIKDKIELIVGEIEGTEGLDVTPISEGGFEYIEKKMTNPSEVPGLPSGFERLDKVLQGFQPGRLYVIGARKKTGKSVILLNWAKYLSVDNQVPVLWISTEHSRSDEFSRLLSLTSEVHESTINNGTFSSIPLFVERVSESLERIKGSPFYFCSMPQFSLEKIRRLARKYARVYGVKALFFDYVKSPEGQYGDKEYQLVGNLAYGLKALAAAEQIPVVTAVQVNREGSNAWKAGEDMDSDYFAGSDRIAQAMSVGMVLRKPNKKECEEDHNRRVLTITDNRHGSSAYKLLLNFDGGIIKMEELAPL